MNFLLDLGCLGDEVECEIDYDYSPATPDVWYMSNGDPGYPGDPEEIIINTIHCHMLNCDLPIARISDPEYDKLCAKISEYEGNKL